MDLNGYEVPRVLVTCRSLQLEVEGEGDENVTLYYYITDNIQIQFEREEICLDEVFDTLHAEDDVSLFCLGILQIVLLGVEAKRRIPEWMLRLANDRGNLPAARLTPDETDARSNWWISSSAYFDGGIGQAERLPRHLNRQNMQTTMSSQAGPSNWQSQMPAQSATPYWQPAFPSHHGTYNWKSSVLFDMGNLNLQPPIERHHDVAWLFNQNILNRGKREHRSSFYKRGPYTKQPPNTILPKQRGSDVIFLGGQFTGNYLVYENVDPEKVKREEYVNYTEFLNDIHQIYLYCYMKGYSVPVTFWQQLVPHLCMRDIDSRTPMGWLSGEHMNA
nr:hypothetical protein [Tanacetum cinerariifolium]